MIYQLLNKELEVKEIEYVYKYVSRLTGDVDYIGITNNMKRRVKQHETDKLSGLNADIYYFPVEYREDANLIETYLISANPSCHKFNESKTKKGDVSFLKNISFPFVRFDGDVDKQLKPFIITQEITKTITKTEYVDRKVYTYKKPNDQIIQDWWDDWTEVTENLDKEIKEELNIVVNLCSLYEGKFGYDDVYTLIVSKSDLLKGIILHQNKLDCLRILRGDYDCFPVAINDEKLQEHRNAYVLAIARIDEHEKEIKDNCVRSA